MRKIMLIAAAVSCLSGCTKYEPVPEELSSVPETSAVSGETPAPESVPEKRWYAEHLRKLLNTMDGVFEEISKPEPVKVKAIYVSGYAAGSETMMNEFIRQIDETELNAVVIDFKNDEGRITCPVDRGVMGEIQAGTDYIPDMEELLDTLEEHDIYTIARVVAFKDPYLAEQKPEWCLKTKTGEIYRDRKGQSWINPYKREVWEYLAEVASEAQRAGFDEVQFDYIRFDTEKTMRDVSFEEADTRGLSKTEIVTEFTKFMMDRFKRTGLFISADVFGAIIGSPVDAEAVGQSYGDMAGNLHYICPMIYPSHYGDGNFGLDHPDMHPYETIMGALAQSKEELARYPSEGQAVVRPWLQDFTASYLRHYRHYGAEELREQINAVYDSGYEEWILWNAANQYSWEGLLKEEEDGENTEGGGILPPL